MLVKMYREIFARSIIMLLISVCYRLPISLIQMTVILNDTLCQCDRMSHKKPLWQNWLHTGIDLCWHLELKMFLWLISFLG